MKLKLWVVMLMLMLMLNGSQTALSGLPAEGDV